MMDELLNLARGTPDDDQPTFYVRRIEAKGLRLELALEFYRHRHADSEVQRWGIIAPQAYRWTMREGRADRVQLTSDHPLLLDYQWPQHELYVSARPDDCSAVVGDLYQRHVACVGSWISFQRYLNLEPFRLLTGGHGKLAAGPEPVVRAYADVLVRRGVRHSTIRSPGPTWMELTRLDRPPSVLLLGETWIVANRFEATRTAVEVLPHGPEE